ncbi:hypothetical protein EAI35_23055, partial [Enterobacter bugandensis]|uniref:hypothetical protein n=2 Tax=Enterobacter bugandensis TaxID=881260 RepID=UPI001133454A
HHYWIVDTAVHGQEIFKTMIHFPNHERIYDEITPVISSTKQSDTLKPRLSFGEGIGDNIKKFISNNIKYSAAISDLTITNLIKVIQRDYGIGVGVDIKIMILVHITLLQLIIQKVRFTYVLL